MSQPEKDVRPSPYLTSIAFRFSVFVFKFCAAACFVAGIFLAFFAIGAVAMDSPEGALGMGLMSIYCAGAGAAFASVMYLLQLLADIEQHTFRAAQCLTRIVESQEKKRSQPKP